jgi:hypothetical protein
MHQQQRRALARLEHTHCKRGIGESDTPAGDLDPTRGKELPLGGDEGCRWIVGRVVGHAFPSGAAPDRIRSLRSLPIRTHLSE